MGVGVSVTVSGTVAVGVGVGGMGVWVSVAVSGTIMMSVGVEEGTSMVLSVPVDTGTVWVAVFGSVSLATGGVGAI